MLLRKIVWCSVFSLTLVTATFATDYSSSNFTAVDPVIATHSGYSTSTNFQLIGSSGPLVIGEGSSPTYLYRAGFLYFPLVTSPLVSAVAGDTVVTLNWTAATAALGFNITGYDVGVGAQSGGPYSFSAVGNVLTSVRSGLTNATPYYFVVRAKDFYLNVIATSTEVVATPTAQANNNPPSSGGSSDNIQNFAGAQFIGKTFPGATVYILENGSVLATVESDAQGNFTYTNTQLNPTNAIFTLYATDAQNERTGSVSFTTVLKAGQTVLFDNILLPPIVTTDKQSVVPGEVINVYGRGIPDSTILISIDEIPGLVLPVVTDKNGKFSTSFSTENFAKGVYTIRTGLTYHGTLGTLGRLIEFTVGDKSIIRQLPSTRCSIADFDCNGKVDLVDFSILLYWFNRPNPPVEINLNADNIVDLIDFSVLMYYWTG